MTYRVIIEPTAQQGIRQAVRWITENQAPARAARWYGELNRKIQSLKSMPHRSPIARESGNFPEEIRELLYGRRQYKYRILFTIRDDAVHILYVRHAAQDELRP